MRMSKSRKAVVRSFAWLVCLAFIMLVIAKVYFISRSDLIAQDYANRVSVMLKSEEERAQSEIAFAEASGKSALAMAEAQKKLATYYMQSGNYAAARDVLLAAERQIALEGDDAAHLEARIGLKSGAASDMASCGLYEVAEPLLKQAERLSTRLAKIDDSSSSLLVQARLLNDQGVLYYLWGASFKELSRRKLFFERAQRYLVEAAALVGRVAQNQGDDDLRTLRLSLRDNLAQVREELAFNGFQPYAFQPFAKK